MNAWILLTGGTGSLGRELAASLADDPEAHLEVLVRASGPEEAQLRLARAWSEQPKLRAALAEGRARALAGDLCAPYLGLGRAPRRRLAERITHVVHCAACLALDAEPEVARRCNVHGTRRLLALARAAHRHHGLARFAHLSTAYVAGGRTGTVAEEDLSDAWGFTNVYEASKYEAELAVRRAGSLLPVSIFRPAMIIGNSRDGALATFNNVYVPLRLYLGGRLRLLPCRPSQPVNVIPVDYVADAVARLSFDPGAEGRTFHLTVPPEQLPTAGELIQEVRRWAREQLGVRLPRPLFVPALGALLSRLPRAAQARLPLPVALLSYFAERRRFQRTNTDRLLGENFPGWREFLPRLLEYAVARSFLHASGRTVHEQVLFRLKSVRRPVRYHDLVEGFDLVRSGAEVREEMLAAAAALRELGVGCGERVAIVGWNSSRYLSLDVAVGLLGAVSVPLYYTSPVGEIQRIVRDSGARLLLVGSEPLLAGCAALDWPIPVISFCRTPPPPTLGNRVLAWEDFLALGESAGPLPEIAPVGLEELATLRYTSGTTGEPKGVGFRHEQLRWLARNLVGLMPWGPRLRPARYLSFLPLNHVVEGILGAYAPYYTPAPVEVYFLEDFRRLPEALRRVRPVVFFSVPRFYEKLWQALRASRPGRLFTHCPPAGAEAPVVLRAARALLRPLVRRRLLRRAGLDRCAQLMAGSAPSSRELLQGFRRLGVEIHDAYGLTEAPLVTLSRPGANHLGTVGQPLPETEIRIAEDGEVLVRGPQVAAVPAPAVEGWLPTGDLGRLEERGDLVIVGRKKEIIVTAYGKNVHPARVELQLKGIPGIHEALLVGDGRPYCTALLWSQDGLPEGAPLRRIAQAVGRINDGLSRPEQVRRWALLPNDLSIQHGELTGNLKLRRAAVLDRRRPVVEALYGAAAPSGLAACFGGEY